MRERESSLPPTLRPHLYHAPRHTSSHGIAPLVVPNWTSQPTRSRSQDPGRFLPSPSHLLRQTEPTLDYDPVILSRPASPINPPFVTNPDLPPPRLVVQRSLPLLDDPPHSIRDHPMGGLERRPSTVYPMNPFEEQRGLQRPPSQPQRQQVPHQPQPQQPARFSQLLSGPGYQGSIGTSSGSQSGPPSRSQTISSFAGELYSEGPPEIKPLYQGSSMAEHPAIETQKAVPGRKKARRSAAVKKEPGMSMGEGGSAGPSTGAMTSTKGKPLAKVSVACNFCRGEHFCPPLGVRGQKSDRAANWNFRPRRTSRH